MHLMVVMLSGKFISVSMSEDGDFILGSGCFTLYIMWILLTLHLADWNIYYDNCFTPNWQNQITPISSCMTSKVEVNYSL